MLTKIPMEDSATPRATGETRDAWISSRIAHILADVSRQVEILDEIMDSAGLERIEAMRALRAICLEPWNSPAVHRGHGALAALFERKARAIAEAEWMRLQ